LHVGVEPLGPRHLHVDAQAPEIQP
jgi:hypothetical protein